MKKKIMLILLVMVVAASVFTGCGNHTEGDMVQTTKTDAQNGQGEAETQTDEAKTEEPTVEPTVQPTPEPTPTAEPTPEPTPAQIQESKQVVTDEWAVDLYNALVKDDYEKVIGLLGDISNAREKCELYKDDEWFTWEGETAYSMLMEDGETLTVTISDWEIWAFVMYDRENRMIVKGDHCVHLNDDGTYAYVKDGNEVVSADPGQMGFEFDDEWTFWMSW